MRFFFLFAVYISNSNPPWLNHIHPPVHTFFKMLSLFKSVMFYCISFRSIIDWNQTRCPLSNMKRIANSNPFKFARTKKISNNRDKSKQPGFQNTLKSTAYSEGAGSTCKVLDLWLKTRWRQFQIFLSILSHNMNLIRVWGFLSLNLNALPLI